MTITNSVYFAKFDSASPAQKDEEAGEVCIANISPLERQKRLRYGIKQFIFTLAILAGLIVLHANPFWRLLLFFPLAAAATGYFQAKDKT